MHTAHANISLKTNTYAHISTTADATHADRDFSALPISQLTGKPVLHFVHANGVPAASYRVLFDVWARYFSIEYIEYFGMHENYPVDRDWRSLTQQVLDSVAYVCTKHGVTQVVAVGHSLGALCSLLAAYQDPTPFAALTLMDPPTIYGKDSFFWYLAGQVERLPKMKYRFSDKMSPAGKSKYRKAHWDSREQAFAALKDKALFAKFDRRCFEDYISHAIVPDDIQGGYSLAISRAVEVAVFRTNPSYFWLKPNHAPAVPVRIVAGRDSPFVGAGYYRQIAKRLKINHYMHQGSHMFPLEYPESVAKTVLDIIKQQLN